MASEIKTLFDYPFNVRQLRDGKRIWERDVHAHLEGFHSMEAAIRELHRRFHAWMSEEFFFSTNGEELEPGVHFDGPTGWYDCSSNLAFEPSDYPEAVEAWIERGITSFRDDVYVVGIFDAEGEQL